MRAGLTPNAVQWCRCGGLRGPNLAECVAVRRRFRAKVGVFWQSLPTSITGVPTPDRLGVRARAVAAGQRLGPASERFAPGVVATVRRLGAASERFAPGVVATVRRLGAASERFASGVVATVRRLGPVSERFAPDAVAAARAGERAARSRIRLRLTPAEVSPRRPAAPGRVRTAMPRSRGSER